MVKTELKLRLFSDFSNTVGRRSGSWSWVKHFASFLPTVLDILTSRLSVSICHFLDWQNINHYFAIGIMVFVLLRMIAELEWSEHLPSHHLLLIWLMIHGKLVRSDSINHQDWYQWKISEFPDIWSLIRSIKIPSLKSYSIHNQSDTLFSILMDFDCVQQPFFYPTFQL